VVTTAGQIMVDIFAVVGAWHLGSTTTRAILYRRQRREAPNLKPYGALPTPWQYRPAAFDQQATMKRTREELRNAG